MAIDRRSSRLGVLALVGIILVGALGTRLWFLQGVQAEAYQESVNLSKIRTVSLPPERGRIFDADGRILADNERVLTVTVEWRVLRNNNNRKQLFDRLSGPLGKPVAELEQRYDDGVLLYDPLLPMPLVEDVNEETVQFLLERSEDFPGVDVVEQWRRVYPYAPLASHVVGYMSAIFKETKDQYLALGYNLNERVGAVRHRAEHGDRAARAVGLPEVGDRRGRQHRASARGGAAGRRQRHPAQHRPRRAAVRRTGARDQAQATPRPADRPGGVQLRRPGGAQPDRPEGRGRRDPRVRELEGLRHRGVDPVQGAGRLGRGARPLQRSGDRDGELSDVRQPLVQRRCEQPEARAALPARPTTPTGRSS